MGNWGHDNVANQEFDWLLILTIRYNQLVSRFLYWHKLFLIEYLEGREEFEGSLKGRWPLFEVSQQDIILKGWILRSRHQLQCIFHFAQNLWHNLPWVCSNFVPQGNQWKYQGTKIRTVQTPILKTSLLMHVFSLHSVTWLITAQCRSKLCKSKWHFFIGFSKHSPLSLICIYILAPSSHLYTFSL